MPRRLAGHCAASLGGRGGGAPLLAAVDMGAAEMDLLFVGGGGGGGAARWEKRRVGGGLQFVSDSIRCVAHGGGGGVLMAKHRTDPAATDAPEVVAARHDLSTGRTERLDAGGGGGGVGFKMSALAAVTDTTALGLLVKQVCVGVWICECLCVCVCVWLCVSVCGFVCVYVSECVVVVCVVLCVSICVSV